MPFNGSGTYTLPSNSWNPAVAATTISATDWNSTANDLATGLSTCITKDGQTTPTANLPMGSFKHTGAAVATASGQYVVYNQWIGGNTPGTVTNDNASSGNIGEFVSATVLSGSAVSLTTGSPSNITSISLTAGDWDVEATIALNPGGSVTNAAGWMSSTSATVPTNPNSGGYLLLPSFSSQLVTYPIGRMRFSLASTTTVYLSTQCTFASTLVGFGFLGARRVR